MADKATMMAAVAAMLDQTEELQTKVDALKMVRAVNPNAPIPPELRPYFEEAKPRPEPERRRDRDGGGDDDNKPWNEGRMVSLAKRLYGQGRDDDAVYAELKKHNDNDLAIAKAMQRGKDEA
jgi:hypothetical protein